MASACTPKTAKEANQVKCWRVAQPRGKSVSSHSLGRRGGAAEVHFSPCLPPLTQDLLSD